MGIIIASLVILFWGFHLAYLLLAVVPSWDNYWIYLHIPLQGFLFTGLFITGHDAMHGTISKYTWINKLFGHLSSFLFAGLSFNKLLKNHKLHHKYPASENDPDFYMKSQNLFLWWFSFLFRYATVLQIVIMAVLYNLLKIYTQEISLWLFWIIPAFWGSFQLFYFGTYLPHKLPHTKEMHPHKARSYEGGVPAAFFSCYFFGYHFEHHESPRTPWWMLPKKRKEFLSRPK